MSEDGGEEETGMWLRGAACWSSICEALSLIPDTVKQKIP